MAVTKQTKTEANCNILKSFKITFVIIIIKKFFKFFSGDPVIIRIKRLFTFFFCFILIYWMQHFLNEYVTVAALISRQASSTH